MDGIYCQWDFFPYSVLICVKSRLRGFRSTEIHAARAVSAISALQAVARSSTSNTIQALARNKRSRSGSAQSAQSAQAVQATRQRSVSASRTSQAERAQSPQSAQSVRKISRSVHFAQYFLSGSAYGEGGNAPQSIKNLFKKQPARGRRLKIIAPFFRCENLFDVGF